MNILILNYEWPPLGGGAAPVSYEIAKGYVKAGHTVDVVTMGFKELPALETVEGIKVFRVPCRRAKKETCQPPEMLSYVMSAKRFLKMHLKENKYDICHTHFILPTGLVARWVKKRFGIPYIITSHGSDVPGYNMERFTWLHHFTKPTLRKICKDATYITTPSQYLKDLIVSNIDASLAQKVIPIPNGSMDLFHKGIKKENIIVSSGRLLKRKGFDKLITAFKATEAQGWKLVIIGDGFEKDALHALAEGSKNIIFTGWLHNKGREYADWMNKAKIFALLSEAESQGIVFLEAMSCGCAILSSDITACKETVSIDVGKLVDRDDQQAITTALRSLMDDKKRLVVFMKNARKRYEKEYQYKNIIKKYEALLR